jgi:hypothetical protein
VLKPEVCEYAQQKVRQERRKHQAACINAWRSFGCSDCERYVTNTQG